MGRAELIMDVVAFTGGRDVPSARFRVRQHIDLLAAQGIRLTEKYQDTDSFPPSDLALRPFWLLNRSQQLVSDLIRSRNFDASLIQREMISSFASFEWMAKGPRIFDVDDSIHLKRQGKAARSIAQNCDRVIAGNRWLAEIYGKWCRDVTIIPTAVDDDLYRPGLDRQSGPTTIGWIGTSSNFVHLDAIAASLRSVALRDPGTKVLVIADRFPESLRDFGEKLEFRRWSSASEVQDIQSMDIGIMPLSTEGWAYDWALGKCSFKMLQYMSCAIPVVVTPVGMNGEVAGLGDIGFAATNTDDWVDALVALIDNPEMRTAKGNAGRKIISDKFSKKVVAGQIAEALRF